MKKLSVITLVILAVVLIFSVVMADVHTAQYKGTATCQMCHKNMHKQIVESYAKTAHPKAMQKADAAGAIVGDFSSNTAFTKDKVAYVLGAGRNQQAYLDAGYKVLPAVWDVKAKAWKTTAAADGATQCIGCHTTGFDAAKSSCVETGVGCEACHGPGSEHVAKPSKDTIVNPKTMDKAKVGMVCGQCHSVGKDTTGKFAHPVTYRPGDDLVKAFNDAKPASSGPNQQYSEFVQSKHAQIGMTCTACHDPHNVAGIGGQLKQPVNQTCLNCHAAKVKDMATHAPNAPAGATCATCHMPGGQHTFKAPGS